MLTVQGLPTSGWGDSEIAELLAKAFMLRSTYTIKEIDGNWLILNIFLFSVLLRYKPSEHTVPLYSPRSAAADFKKTPFL